MTNIVKYEHQQQKIKTFKELTAIAVKSGSYNMSAETLTNLMLSADDLGVSPMKAINGGFHVIQGKIVMAGHLICDRIRAAGHSVKVVEHTREKCVIIGVRKDNGDSYKSEYEMEDAKLAGLQGSNNWRKYPKDMLYNRAIARLGRVLFADVVGSCYSEDEGDDIANIPPEDRKEKDPDEGILIDVEIAKAKLTEAQCAELDMLLENEEREIEKIKKFYKLDSVYDLPSDKFDHVIAVVKQRKEARKNDKSNIA